jgi:DNA-binding NtrC family response regulator
VKKTSAACSGPGWKSASRTGKLTSDSPKTLTEALRTLLIGEEYCMSVKVLIVDDEKDFLEIIAERIAARGIDVSTASSAENALNMIEEESYEVVVMDFMMPALDGFKALKLMKAKRPEMQIILLTGNVPDEKRIEAKALGALDVIEKPPDLQDLIEKIKKAQKGRGTK